MSGTWIVPCRHSPAAKTTVIAAISPAAIQPAVQYPAAEKPTRDAANATLISANDRIRR